MSSRVFLRVLAKALFTPKLNIKELLRELPRSLPRGLWTLLVTQRFSPSRAFNMPLLELEGKLDAERRSQRLNSLRSLAGSSGSLTFSSMFIETIALLGLWTLAYLFLPNTMSETSVEHLFTLGLDGFHEVIKGYLRVLLILAPLSYLLVEPFYIGAGFVLYLNARTILEGWDIELSFRRLEQRLAQQGLLPQPMASPHRSDNDTAETLAEPPPLTYTPPLPVLPARNLAPAFALLLALGLGCSAQPLHASPTPTLPTKVNAQLAPSPDESAASLSPQQQAQEILRQPEFEIQKRSVPITRMPEARERSVQPSFFGLEAIIGLLSIVAVVGALIWLLIKALQLSGNRRSRSAVIQNQQRVTQIAGLNLHPDSLPDDIVTAARAAWAAGNPREALSLLYRGSLSWLLHHGKLPIASSDTESDALRRLHRQPQLRNLFPWMQQLTSVWLLCAYARLAPEAATFDELCQHWPFHRQLAAELAAQTPPAPFSPPELPATP